MPAHEFDDDLSDLIGGQPRQRPAMPEFKPVLERVFTEACPACGGSGRWRGIRQCFKCKGTGKLSFKTPAEDRAKARAGAAERRVAKAVEQRAEAATWREQHQAEVAWLNETAERQHQRAHRGQNVWNFPIELTEKLAQYGTLTDGQIGAIRKCMLRDAERAHDWETRRGGSLSIEAGKIEAAFATARAKAARPGAVGIWTKPLTLRAQNVDLTFQPGSEGSQWAGMIFVKTGDTKLGFIKAGEFKPRFECTDALKAAVIEACEDPAKAAIAYGKAWSVCSVCNRTLTNDESIARGIGPICADRMGSEMATKHTATDSKGKTHKRVSVNRTYSHAIVAHYRAVPATKHHHEWPADHPANGQAAWNWHKKWRHPNGMRASRALRLFPQPSKQRGFEMRVVREWFLDHSIPFSTTRSQYRVFWHVEHNGKVLNSFRTRAQARTAIRDSGKLAEKLTEKENA